MGKSDGHGRSRQYGGNVWRITRRFRSFVFFVFVFVFVHYLDRRELIVTSVVVANELVQLRLQFRRWGHDQVGLLWRSGDLVRCALLNVFDELLVEP
jgi:hypothetical protein